MADTTEAVFLEKEEYHEKRAKIDLRFLVVEDSRGTTEGSLSPRGTEENIFWEWQVEEYVERVGEIVEGSNQGGNWTEELFTEEGADIDFDGIPEMLVTISYWAGGNSLYVYRQQGDEVLVMYEVDVSYKVVKLSDWENGANATYFLPIIEEVDCMSEETIYNCTGNRIEQLVLEKERIGNRVAFRVKGYKRNGFIARLDYVESILRRGVEGIRFEEICVRN